MTAAAEASSWVKRLARVGLAANGLIYGTIGVLALNAVLNRGGETTDKEGAVRALAEQPFGQALVWFLVVGLASYALWRFVQAYQDPFSEGGKGTEIVRRVAFAVTGLIALGVAYYALDVVVDVGGGGSGGGKEAWTATLLQQPFGAVLVALIGVAVLGAGAYQGYRAVVAKFREKLKEYEMEESLRQLAIVLGRAGLAARAAIFGLIGYFFLQAAWQSDPSEVGGIEEALTQMAQGTYGAWILGAVAIGLIAFGIYAFIDARYRQFDIQ